MCQIIHESVTVNSAKFLAEMSRYNYVTPTSYLELLGIFSKLVGMKKLELTTAKRRLKTGLEKVHHGFSKISLEVYLISNGTISGDRAFVKSVGT